MALCGFRQPVSSMELEVIIDVSNMEHTREPTKEELKARKHCLERRAHKLEAEGVRLEELFRKRQI